MFDSKIWFATCAGSPLRHCLRVNKERDADMQNWSDDDDDDKQKLEPWAHVFLSAVLRSAE